MEITIGDTTIPVTVIYGGQGTFKTTKAESLTKGKETLWTSQDNWAKDTTKLEESTEVIVIDNILSKAFARRILDTVAVSFRKPKTNEVVEYDLPELILISSVLKMSDFEGTSRVLTFYNMSPNKFPF